VGDPEVFVSYASEDREVAERIARELTEMGIPTFFDRFSLKVGESTVESIQRGLSSAKFGVVILSPHYLEKDWPREELKQLFRGHIENRQVLLPVWHNVTQDLVRERQPGLEDIWATNTDDGLRAVVRALAEQIVGAKTVTVVPLYQRPVERFLNGEGELTLGIEGPAFTMWEALLNFGPDAFPLYVEGETLERDLMLQRAAEILARRPEAAAIIGDDGREKVAEMCRTEIGLDPAKIG
jgi:hypothetical protein